VRATPHTFRHQAITWLTRHSGLADAELQLITGHARRGSLAVYQHVALDGELEQRYPGGDAKDRPVAARSTPRSRGPMLTGATRSGRAGVGAKKAKCWVMLQTPYFSLSLSNNSRSFRSLSC
jgi:hypothetical protein